MNANIKTGTWGIRLVLFLAAGLMAAGMGCDETGLPPGMFGPAAGVDGSGTWYSYGWNEVDGNGHSRSFSLNPGTDPHDALQTYLSDSVVYN